MPCNVDVCISGRRTVKTCWISLEGVANLAISCTDTYSGSCTSVSARRSTRAIRGTNLERQASQRRD